MKVLHLNQSDIGGGAAIAAHRLHQGLLGIGVDSGLLVPEAVLNEQTTTVLPPMSLTERALLKLTFPIAPNNTTLLRSWKIPRMPVFRKADVIHFHNLHTGLYFNYLSIPQIAREKPVVFTLHDMWAFTGHCSYSYDCERWRQGCGRCPYPETYPAVQWDNTAIEWWLKRQVYAKSKLTIVTPSGWLSSLARQSILGKFPIHVIPYGIDINIYHPMDKTESRRKLDLPLDKSVLMFASADLRDSRKGIDILVKLLKSMPEDIKKDTVLLAMGRDSSGLAEATGIRTIETGYVEGDEEKARHYSAADIFISTTRADNLPMVLQESMACGTPMLASRVGGITDLVREGETGFTVPAEDIAGMAERLIKLLQDAGLRREMSARCRQLAISEYASEVIAQQYGKLYQSLIPNR